MKEKLLFVTKGGEGCDEGFSYVLELAKSLNAGIEMLMVYGKGVLDKYEDVMAAVAFAEAGDLATVEELMNSQEKRIKETAEKKISELSVKCREISVDLNYQIVSGDAADEIKNFLNKGILYKPGINMILLSPNLVQDKKGIDLKKLVKNITKPIVTITKPAEAGA